MAEKKKNQDDRPYIHVEGGIHVQRDMIMGDQYNQIVQNVENNPTPGAFTVALWQIRQELSKIKAQSDLTAAQIRNIEFVEVKVLEAEQKASLPEPPVEDIKTDLIEAKETMDAISGGLASAIGLGALLGNLIGMVGRAFGLF
jgi:hypothetical protein